VVVRTVAPAAVSAPAASVDRTPAFAATTEADGTSDVAAVVTSPPTVSRWASRLAGVSWAMMLLVVYIAGVLWFSTRLLGQHLAVRRFARRASLEADGKWVSLISESAASLGLARPVRLLRSRELVVPSMFGVGRPTIVLPAIADTWQDDRRRVAIVHELAHVARLDCFTQALAGVACALYWFHPGVWWLARRMRVERELACDDLVIAAGVAAREYADHLLEIAYSLGGGRVPALAVGMARPRELEGRLMAALDASRNRRVPASRFRAACLACATVLVVPLAAATPTVAPSAAEQQEVPAAATNLLANARPVPSPTVEAAVADANVAAHAESRPSPVDVPVAASESLGDRAVSMLTALVQDEAPGTWKIRPTDRTGFVHLRLVERHSSSGEDVPVSTLDGLTGAQLTGPGGPVRFRITRDAGTFTFDGVLHSGVGAGTFSFTPDPAFPMALEKRGFARPTAHEQYQMAREDIGFAFLDELNRQGYAKPDTAELVRAGEHGVNVRYLRDMDAAGYRVGSLPSLTTLRDHGVTAAYIRALQDAGYKNLPVDTVRRARDHGITIDYMKGLRDAGYGSLPIEELIRTRDHGVTPDFIKAMTDAGYGKLPLRELVNTRDHGVTPDFIHDLAEAGYTKLPLDEVVRARDHGVSSDFVRGLRALGYTMPLEDVIRVRDHGIDIEFVRTMAGLGYKDLPIDALVRLRDHGVSARFAQDLRALGYDHLAPEDLVMLRDHGLTADRIRAANARAGTRLPLDMLRSLAAGGGWR
jgi:beta-lactamase regulating signal transducer with metallopeptidase domain